MIRLQSIDQRTLLGIILVVALSLRLLAGVFFDPPLSSDDKDYVELAETVVRFGTYTTDGSATAYRPPGYPFFLASVFGLFGPSLLAVRLIQAFIDTLTCLLVYRLAVRQMSVRYALGAAFAYALFPLQILYAATILTETVFTFLFVGAFVILSEQESGERWLLAGGFLAGMAVLFRPVALILPIIFLITPAMRDGVRWTRMRRAALVLAGMLLVVAPWMIRNTVELGRPLITTNTGVNFWIGNHDGANGGFSYPVGNPLTRIDDEVERSSEGLRLGMAYVLSHPLGAGMTMIRKFAHMFSIDYWVLISHHGLSDRANGRRAVEIYRMIPMWSILVTHVPVMLVSLLTVLSLCAAPPTERRTWLLFLVLIAGWICLHLVFFGSARYRFPLHPILLVTAVHGWSLLRSHTYVRTKRHVLLAAALIILLLAGWSIEVFILAFS